MTTGAGSPVIAGPDGVLRCPWALAAPEYLAYHDDEWARPVHGDVALLERITLEGFQSGLSWLTILRKRPAFRRAFAGFDPVVVAAFGAADRDRLRADAGIVRNAAKIDAAVANARAVLALWANDGVGALDRLVWSHAPQPPPGRAAAPVLTGDLPASTPASAALARALRRAGFRFVGPTTTYATMQACGLVDDHLAGCACRGAGQAGTG